MKKIKKALITGVTGQDGSYLAELLLAKGYKVYGMVRRASTFNTERIDFLKKFKDKGLFSLHYGDLADSGSIDGLMAKIKPDEIYNLGAQSHVRISFDIPEYTSDITGLGTLRMLEAMKKHCPHAKFYQASSSEMFGKVLESPQTEKTFFNAQSPYGIAKVFAHETARRYRDAYELFVCCGILFNHESPRRGENFVTRKITIGIANIINGQQKELSLGNLDAKRDWGYCYDDKTEILTKEGWKLFKDVKQNDHVATLNKLGFLEYQKPIKIIREKYNGEVILFQNRHLDLAVTPNHIMYVKETGEEKYKLIPAEKIFKSIGRWRFKKDAFWRGQEENFFVLPSVSKYKSKRLESTKKLDMNNWLEFLGWFISEGYTGNGKKGNYRVGISQDQKKSKYRTEIKDCIKSLRFKYSENKHEFRIGDKQLWSYLVRFGGARHKYAPFFVKELPPKQIKIFLNALFKGDGNGEINVNKNCNFYTSSKKLINDVQELLFKCGLSGNIKKHKNRNNSYRINVISKYNTPGFRGNTNHVLRYTKYNGEIFCCTVPNHVVYVRRNGKGCWSGNSPEYCEAMWLMLQQKNPDDFIIATGETHSVREFVWEAFRQVGVNIIWKGQGLRERGINKKTGKVLITIDPKYFRPNEVDYLCGDFSKARKMLGWKPKTSFKQLVKVMLDADIKNK